MYKNSMKIAGILLLALVFFGCDLAKDEPEVLINNRINGFESTLNSGVYTNLKTHFHPEMPSYDSYSDDVIFTSGPLSPSNAPFTFGVALVEDISGSDNMSATGTYGNKTDSSIGNYAAVMKEDGDDWKILEMVITVGTTPYTIRTLSE